MTHPKKQQKTDRHHGGKSTKIVSNRDYPFVAETFPKSLTFTNSEKWSPGTSRTPKGIQKVSKRRPKGVQKASRRRPNSYKLDPTGITILKSQCKELQRTLHPIRIFHLNKNRSTCKADLSSHLDCSHLSQCCFLTCSVLG